MDSQNNNLLSSTINNQQEQLLKNILNQTFLLAKGSLQNFASNPNFTDKMHIAFINNTDVSYLKTQWQTETFIFPDIEIVSATDINGANGAYVQQTNKIYLAQEFLLAHQSEIDVVAAVLIEEYGHHLDSVINSVDTPGDEGAIFSALVRGEELSQSQLQQLRNENDSAVVIIDGESIEIEQSNDANPFYEYEVIAQTDGSDFTFFGTGVSINDSGNVAFSAVQTTGKESVYTKFKDRSTPVDITGFDRKFGDYVQINNNNRVVATERSNNSEFAIRTWDANNPGIDNSDKFIGASLLENAPFNPRTILPAPSISDNNEFVFSALNQEDFTVVTTSTYATNNNFDEFQNTLNLGLGAQRTRPMMDNEGNFVMRFLDRDSAITLFEPTGNSTGKSFETTGIATGADGFSDRGLSPGINDDGQIIGFYASLSDSGADDINVRQSNLEDINGNAVAIPLLTPGDGIFASIAFNDERIITRIAGIAGNGQLDPGETFEDADDDGIVDPGEDVGIFSSFDSDSRVGIGFGSDIGQIAYLGVNESGNKGVYTSSINLDLEVFSITEQPKVDIFNPQLVAEAGQILPSSTDTIKNLEIYDPINNNGEIAFWAETGSGEEAIIKANPIRRPVLILPGIAGNYAKLSEEQTWLLNRGVHPDLLQIDPLGGVYNDLIQSFKNAGYIEGEDLFIANYDWRLPPGPLDNILDGKIDGLSATEIVDEKYLYGVDYLGYFLRQASEKWELNNPDAPPLESVDIVAHSTGGLVARTYIQSDAYGQFFDADSKLPTVENFTMLGVPNRGAAKAWNPLHNDWDADPAYQYVLSKIINLAYQKVLAGKIIEGTADPSWEHPGDISLDTIKDSNSNPNLEEFIRQYVPTIKTLLATYPFIDRGNGLETVNQNQDVKDSDSRNSLVLDLNAGLDFNVNGDPNGFADNVGQVTVIYGESEETPTTVTELKGGTGEISGFQDFRSRPVSSDETWYRDDLQAQNGDATVPLESSMGQFNVGKPNIKLRGFIEGDNTNENVTHTGLVSNVDVQLEVFQSFGISIDQNLISTGLAVPNFASLVRTLSAIGQSQNVNATTAIFDPVEGFLVDANGNRLGYSQETGVLNEIPNSIYLGEEDGIGWIFDDVAEPLEIQLTGLGEDYYVQVSSLQQGQEVGGFESSGFLASGEQQSFAVELEIDNTDTTPIANADNATINIGESVSINVLENDSDPNGNVISINSFNEVSAEEGTITLDNNETPDDLSDDVLVYTPASEFSGADSFSYTISNGTNTATATVNITVNPGSDNQNPIAEDDTFSFEYGTSSFTGNVLTNDSDPNGDEITVSGVSEQPSEGVATIEADGSFTYSFNSANFIGTDSFVYEVSDSEGNTDTATVTIEVSPNIEFPFQVGQVDLIEDSRLTAPLSDGGFITIGNQVGTEFLPGNLMGQRYDASGEPVGNSFLIHAWAEPIGFSGYAGEVSLSSSSNGGFMVVLNDSPTLEKDVYIYDENANLITRHKSTLSSEAGYRSGGSITGDSSAALTNGNYVVVPSFSGTASPNNDVGGFIGIEIYDSETGELLNSETNSNSIFNPETLRIPENKIIEGTNILPEIENLEYPKVASLSNGGFVVAYSGDRRNVNTGEFEEVIFAQVFDSQANKVGEEIVLFFDLTQLSYYGSIAQGDYSITGLEDGGFVVAYNNYSQMYRLEDSKSQTGNEFEADVIPRNEGLVARRYDNDGNAVGDLIDVKTGASGIEAPVVPSVVGLDNGNFLITNSSSLRRNNNLFRGQLFDAEGNPIGNEFIIEEYPGFIANVESLDLDYSRKLSLAELEDGTLLLTGKENDGDSEANDYGDDYIYTQRLKLNVSEDGTEVSVEPIGNVSTLAQYAGENPPFNPQPLPDTSNGGNNESDSKLSINDALVAEGNEGNTELVFTVSLSEASDETITVDYATADDLATAAADYTAANGTLEFAPGETSKTITVQISGDTEIEQDETFDVRLSNPTNASLSDGRGVGTITNDDVTTPSNNLIELFRFRNKTFATGTYVFVGEAERDFILKDPNLSNTFALDGVEEDGTVNAAFTASTVDEDGLIPFYRLESLTVAGTFLFVSTAEYEFIFNDPVQSEQWKKQGFDESGETDIAEFYLIDSSADTGIQFNRFQNLQNGTFLYAGEAETEAILDNPNLSSLFKDQGVAFESFI